MKKISGNIVDVLNNKIYPGTLEISNGKIINIQKDRTDYATFIIPGFIDSHIHIESSMLVPSEFARIASVHGTVAVISDPHEIANVLGVDGIRYMIENSKTVPMKFYFGAPSCVPATDFETSGAVIGPEEVEGLLRMKEIKYLAEVMNFPGVISDSPDITEKISIAKKYSKIIDGHAPGLRGKDLNKYINAGISTDHESFTREEALEKIQLGMKILIREGSAAKNFAELIPLVEKHYESCMFCSDDKHPDELLRGHINELVKRAFDYGIDIIKILRVACVNPVFHYKLDVGLLRKGDSADFLIIDNIRDFNVLKTYIKGEIAAEEGRKLIPESSSKIVNNFIAEQTNIGDFVLPYKKGYINVIEAIDGQIITNKLVLPPKVIDGYVLSDLERDILKIAIINRYKKSKIAMGFVKNFGLKEGAIASSIAHDSHNIVVVGTTERDMYRAVNLIIEQKGGISAVSRDKGMVLPLPVAGIMSNRNYSEVAEKYSAINEMAKYFGSTLHAPFMTLSFMTLLVIPKIKLSDRGLFDVEKFDFISVFE
ncbi:MAG: adenine deaminase [Nitrospirae bacterium RBG_13_41_22]|nr:MAG: adenine deaminase [Nitrospirae bacterium RBG_13_41_22]